ncbi:MAG: sugar ABC transporter substrate-binding protein [Treponema sp.]|jgi:ribose transport system substrate-binding protein|nr:sugar ABC transporter substrate-binding protein [Treponema sp.]
MSKTTVNRIALFSILLLAGIFSACTAGQQASKDKKGDKIVIGLSEPNLGWPYIAAFVREFKPIIDGMDNVEAIVLSADGNIEKQINDINDLIVEGVDIILVCSLDGEAVIPALAKAHAAGIPVLAVSNMPGKDGEQYITGYSGPDDYEQGRIAAQIMVDAIGTSGNIIMIEGTAGQSTTLLRAQGWNDKMAGIAPGMKLLASQPCDWDGAKEKAAMQAFVTRYGSQINGVFAQGSGASVAEAVRDAGLNAPVVCTGADVATLEAIKAGYLYGTMQQSPYLDASQAIDLAIKIVGGEKLPAFRNIIPMPAVTAKNVKDIKPDY